MYLVIVLSVIIKRVMTLVLPPQESLQTGLSLKDTSFDTIEDHYRLIHGTCRSSQIAIACLAPCNFSTPLYLKIKFFTLLGNLSS